MLPLRAPTLLLVTPYLADANNGNWRTAARWSRLLAPWYRVIVQAASDPVTGERRDAAVALVALHARRSHAAIAAWRAAHPDRGLVLAMTGTDLYLDLPRGDDATCASIALADHLIVLQEDAARYLPADARTRSRVVYQSARALKPWPHKRDDRLHCVLVAHLRPEKDPTTALAAWRRLPADVQATLTVIGAALDPALGRAVRDVASADPRVHWLGPKDHAWTRQAIKRAHLLLIPSRLEGGANVVVEAITAGTPVLGSRMSGNVGMLGSDYGGYFPVGDAAALASLVARAAADRQYLALLAAQCERRASRFARDAETTALAAVVAEARAAHAHRMLD